MNKLYIEQINNALEQTYIDNQISEQLMSSIKYSIHAGGKRIRPLLLMTTLESLNMDTKLGLSYGTAIEMIHTYSLIHDDLPAMDDDDYRRGQLTNHKVYGEATAILAGDALLTDSFLQITQSDYTDAVKIELLNLLIKAAGSKGMVAGQMLDMESENKQVDLQTLEKIHHHKTGDLIHASIYAAGIIAESNDETLASLETIGRNVGLMFQIKDDILDVEGSFEEIGKQVGSDISNHKSTYVSLIGLEESKALLNQLLEQTIEEVKKATINDKPLIDLITFIVERNK